MAAGETEYVLQEEHHATFDANGEAWVRGLGPNVYGERWAIEATQTRVENSVSESRLEVYRNGTTQIVEGTYSGNQDNSNTRMELNTGEKLWYRWTRGDPGAQAILTLTGKRIVKGRRGY